MKRLLAALFSIVLATAAAGCKDMKAGYEKGFKDSFLKKFKASCESEAVKKDSSADLAKSYCDCVGSYLTNKYSSTDLTRIAMKGDAKEINEAVKSCNSN